MTSRNVLAVVATAALMGGCSAYSPVSPSGSPQEDFILAETQRVSAILHVKVVGQLSNYVYSIKAGTNGCPVGPIDCIAAGWYESGTAYYYQPWVVKQYNFKDLSDTAIHEVCHAVEFTHNERHAKCVKSVPY